MDVKEASEILEAYRACIAKGTEGGTILRRVSLLPYSKAKIEYAYFVSLEDVVRKKGHLAFDQRKDMVEAYSILNNFVDDDLAHKYAKIYKDWQSKKTDPGRNKKDERLIRQYIAYTRTLRGDELSNEINDYIEELLK